MQKKLYILLIIILLAPLSQAEERGYFCEFGLQGGLSYYVGDATKHIFQHIQPAGGLQFRYKFTSRWAIQTKAQYQQIKFPAVTDEVLAYYPELISRDNKLNINRFINIDAVAEFNFFRFGGQQYDSRVHPFTPYIFMGIGASTYSDFSKVGIYFPFGLGLKWKFGDRWGMNLAWQQQLYFHDNLENLDYYNNTHELNGSNILNNDFTSTLTLGIVFEFARDRGECRTCRW